MVIPRDILRTNKCLNDWAILIGWRGSIAHGMYIPSDDPKSIDDKDVMGICVPPIEYYYGLEHFGSRGTQEIKRQEWDIVVYELLKFVSLLEKGNPNVLSLLWLKPNHYIKTTPEGLLLVENRSLFVGKHVYHSFAGYAHGQLHRMTHQAYRGYMGEKRRALVDAHGFDTKNAAHLIRLLRMAIEFLGDGELRVEREDAAQLLQIKRGEWNLESVKIEATRLFQLAEEAYVRSKLPAKLDRKAINSLCVGIIATRHT